MATEAEFAFEAGIVTIDPQAPEAHEWADDAILGIVIEPQGDAVALKYTPHAGI